MKIDTNRPFQVFSASSRCKYVPFVFGLLALYIALVSIPAVSAQTAETGALNGTVSDPSGKVVPGVSVNVTSVATGQVRTAVTQGNGSYRQPCCLLVCTRWKHQRRTSKLPRSST